MNTPKLRRILILVHLYLAAFMVPAFLLLTVSGGLHLVGGGEQTKHVPIQLSAHATLDFKSPTLEADIRALLKSNGIDHDFEYVRSRPNGAQLRPTSRTYIEFRQTPKGLTASRNTPNLQASLMEIHKGHGPRILRAYHKMVALAMFIVVLGGVFVGLLARTYRRQTLIASAFGIFVYGIFMYIL